METVNVVSAIIHDGDYMFVAQRGNGKCKGYWEFPGGKIEANETDEEALVREIQEELDITINVENFVENIVFPIPTRILNIRFYNASIKEGSIKLLEHSDSKWITKDSLDSVDWLPSDIQLINKLKTA